MRARPFHWIARFARSVLPLPVPAEGEAWVRTLLSDSEWALFQKMSSADRRHALRVARAADAALSADEERLAPLGADGVTRRDVLAAALLHDVGKTAARLGTYGRVIATLSGMLAPDMAEHWQQTQGFTRSVGLYLRYPQLGAEMLEVAGAAPLVVAWAREHHEPADTWSVPAALGELLVACDN